MINDYAAYYPMNEESGGRVIDMSKNQNEGTATNTTITTGIYGNGRSFDGTNDFITVTSHASINLSVFSLAAWINPTSKALNELSIFGHVSDNAWQLRIEASDKLELLKQGTASIGISTGTVTYGSWQHIGVTYDASGNYVFYINAVASGSGINFQSFSFSNLLIGDGYRGENELYKGIMDEVRIYPRVLVTNDFKELYTFAWQTKFNNTVTRPAAFKPGIAK